MGNLLSPLHIILILLILIVFFGRGKISGFMGDLAKGIKTFKNEMGDADQDEASVNAKTEVVKPEVKTIEAKVEPVAAPVKRAAPKKKVAAKAPARTKTTKTVARKTTTARKTTKAKS